MFSDPDLPGNMFEHVRQRVEGTTSGPLYMGHPAGEPPPERTHQSK